MTLPVLSKTWQHNVNNAVAALGSTNADSARILRLVKNGLIGFASNAWVVRYSCNGVTAGTAGDGVDRWVSDSDVVLNSWMVLRQVGIATNFEICIYIQSGLSNVTIVVSYSAGFTGGTTSARPTATDESVLLSGASYGGVSTLGSDAAQRYSISQSSDGQCTRIWFATSGQFNGLWVFDKVNNPTSGWNNPSYSVVTAGANSQPGQFTNLSGNFLGFMRSGTTNGRLAMSVEAANSGNTYIPSGALFQVANEIDGNWPMAPIGLVCNTVGIRGRHGTLFDIWWGANAIATGDTYPNDSSNQFVQIGNIILPWNGGAVNLT